MEKYVFKGWWVAPSFSTTYNERIPAVSNADLASTWFFS